MNAINWKKLLLPNIPYLLFVYLFDKVGQAVRLSPGADLSGKVLSLGEGFSAAFANPLPSLAPMDLLIGILGAVLIRLIVYVKGKNAKKYRKGVEYGSARWGTAEDIKPYTDPVFQNNVLLTQTERLSMNSRPKQGHGSGSLPVTPTMRLIISRRLHPLPGKSLPRYSGRISGRKKKRRRKSPNRKPFTRYTQIPAATAGTTCICCKPTFRRRTGKQR